MNEVSVKDAKPGVTMAVPYLSRLRARLEAQAQVQVKVTAMPTNFSTSSLVPLEGQVVRIFRSDSSLAINEPVRFSVHVRKDDEVVFGIGSLLYDRLVKATYLEVYLNGSPPECEAPLAQYRIVDAPSEKPRLRASKMAYYLAWLREKLF